MKFIVAVLFGAACLASLFVQAPEVWAGTVKVTSPRGGTYRPGQTITVQWGASLDARGKATVRLAYVKGTRPAFVLARMATWSKKGLRVRIPADVHDGSYYVEVVQGRDRGRSPQLEVLGRIGPPPTPPIPPQAKEPTITAVTHPRRGVYYAGQSLTVRWEASEIESPFRVAVGSDGFGSATMTLLDNVRVTRRGATVVLPERLTGGHYAITVSSGDALARSARFRVEPPPRIAEGRTEHVLHKIEFLDADRQLLDRRGVIGNAFELPFNGGSDVRLTMLVEFAILRPLPAGEVCTPGVTLDFAFSHFPSRRYDMAGRVFSSPFTFSRLPHGGQVRTVKIPLRIPPGTPTGVTMTGTATLWDISRPECDQDRTNNTADFTLHLVPYRPNVDLRLEIKDLRVATGVNAIRGRYGRVRFKMGARAESTREEVFGVKARWRVRQKIGDEWEVYGGDGTSGWEHTFNRVYPDRVVWHDVDARVWFDDVGHAGVLDQVTAHLHVILDPEREVDDPQRRNNDLTRQWEW